MITYWTQLYRLFAGQPSAEEWERFYRLVPRNRIPWEPTTISPWISVQERSGYFSDPVLDIGCGFGLHATWLAQHGHSVTGVDISPAAIAEAQRRSGRKTPTDFRIADGLALPFADGTFATVLDRGTYHHQGRHKRRYLEQVRRVLRPDGRFILLAFGPHFPHPRSVTVREVQQMTAGLMEIEETGRETHVQPDRLRIPLLTARLRAI